MYKLGILILLSSHFVFANANIDRPHDTCESNTPERDTEISTLFTSKACEYKRFGLITTLDSNCVTYSKSHIDELKENGWSQKQINYISFYILKNKPKGTKLDLNPYKYLLDNHPESPLKNPEELNRLVREARSKIGLTSNNRDGVSLVISGCTDLFPEPSTEPEPESSSVNLLPEICESNDEARHQDFRDIFRVKSCEYSESSLVKTRADCMDSTLSSINTLKEKGWSQKQINYISHYALLNKSPESERNIYTYLAAHLEDPFQTNIKELVNKARSENNLNPLEEDLTLPQGCTNLFKTSSETEATAPCIDCVTGAAVDSAIEQLVVIAEIDEDIDEIDEERDREEEEREERNRNIISDLSDCKNKRDDWEKISTTRICHLLEQLHEQTSSVERLTQYNTEIQGQLWGMVKQQSLNSFNQYASIQKMMSQIGFFPSLYPQQNLELISSINDLQQEPWFEERRNQISGEFNQLTGRMDAIIELNSSGQFNPSLLIRSKEAFDNLLLSTSP